MARSMNSAHRLELATAPQRPAGWPGRAAPSGGTGYSCSPDTCSGARLVARTRRLGQRGEQLGDQRRGAQHLLEVVEHQQRPLRRRWSMTQLGRARHAPGVRRCRAPARWSAATRAGSVIVRQRRRSRRRRGMRSAASAATWSDSRVLPVPPGPGQRQQPRAARAAPAASASSRSRPRKVVSWVGRLLGTASRVRSGGKSAGRPVDDQLVEPLRARRGPSAGARRGRAG